MRLANVASAEPTPALAPAARADRVAESRSPRGTASGMTLLVDLRSTLVDAQAYLPEGERHALLVVSNHWPRRSEQTSWMPGEAFVATAPEVLAPVERIILFLPARLSTANQRVVDRCVTLAAESLRCRVCLVSSFGIHLGDEPQRAMETALGERFGRVAPQGCVVVRPGNVVDSRDRHSPLSRWLAALYPLVSARFRSVFVDQADLFSAIREILRHENPRNGRVYTLLGANRPLRDVLAERAPTSVAARGLTGLAHGLRLLLIPYLVGMLFGWAARWHRPLRRWQFDMLVPQSTAELLALYNPFNRRHVALAGYNTGVTHFGWKYPGRTVVKTIGSGRRVRLGPDTVDADAGVTLKRVVERLDHAGRQLFVVPNYSYISLGTIFMVPVHGSGSDVSTLGDTIERVLLYDPTQDRLLSVKRGDPRFDQAMYNPRGGMLVLRLRLRTRSKTRYEMRRSTLDAPPAEQIWAAFADGEASNIELRKAGSAAMSVDVYKYFPASVPQAAQLDEAKDSLGRLWDRLEENPITSVLFHGLTRHFLYHVELFLDEREFGVFWRGHGSLRLLKIQLRQVRPDGLPNSPIGDRTCISADIVMRRSSSAAFLTFMKAELPDARFNAGKHSM